MPLPGPGLAIVAAGLAILARDFEWAERTLDKVIDRLPQDDDGNLSRGTWWSIAFSVVSAVSFSIWWYFIR